MMSGSVNFGRMHALPYILAFLGPSALIVIALTFTLGLDLVLGRRPLAAIGRDARSAVGAIFALVLIYNAAMAVLLGFVLLLAWLY